MATFTLKELEFFIHHLFLPPRLPQKDDHDANLDKALLQLVVLGLESFANHVSREKAPTVQRAVESIQFLIDSCEPYALYMTIVP
jgi:hypothetical protein